MSTQVGLLLIGDEVLAGRIRDTNGAWLASDLRERGARVREIRVVGDDTPSIREGLLHLAEKVDVVLVTGGLGPTDDDGTRAALAEAAGVSLVEHPDALEALRQAQAARGWELDERRRREACLPRGADWLPNPEGTAPGISMRLGGTRVFAMPGVPREMRAMFEASVVPFLRGLAEFDPPVETAFRVGGLREPDVATTLEDLDGPGGVHLAFYPHEGELEVRFEVAPGAETRLAAATADARMRLGSAVYENHAVETEVTRLLREQGRSVTTAESLTGGLVASMLTAVPGASDLFRGGWVTYSDAWKREVLGVSAALLDEQGAVSTAVARAMAEGARARAGTTAAIALTGVAGPGDGANPKGEAIPAGTWFVGLAFEGRETEVQRLHHPSSRNSVRRRAAVSALEMLRRALLV